MADGIYAALSGAVAHYTALETTAQNLANVDTTGYRALTPVFREVLSQTQGRASTVHFSAVRKTAVDMTPGALRETGNPLDVALGPSSFLALETPAGERYTRGGSLKVAPNGTLTTQRGVPLLNEANKRIVVDPNLQVEISPQGEVMSGGESLGYLKLMSFERPEQLTYEGQGVLAVTAEAGRPTRSTEPLGIGKLEESNASTVRAMTDLMAANRLFDAMEQAIGTFSQLDRRLITAVPKMG